ncbi:HNH endonuclease [Streptomyces buecherae]|nr:HNH endonuclease [Streptomyces buecherae]
MDDVVRACGGQPSPGSRRYARKKCADEGIDVSHLDTPGVRHTEERLRAAVADACSVADVVRRLGINPVGGNQAHISRRITALGIDTSHFTGRGAAPRRKRRRDPLALGSPSDGRTPGERLRAALVRRGVPQICAMCGTGTEWNGRPLRLEVDHRNSAWWDNRPENLRFLCPNCHAVTDSYRGRQRRREAP